jgi:hypothetical protein
MIFGHNTDVKVGEWTFHVQTEDRGEGHALIDTTVYYRGRVLHRRTNNYYDLMPLDDDRRQALKLQLDEQHRVVLAEMRNGKLQLKVPETTKPASATVTAQTAAGAQPERRKLSVELLNPKAWLSGKHASLQVAVKEEGAAVKYAHVSVEVEGGAYAPVHGGDVNESGEVQIEFEMPKITGSEAALVIRAENEQAAGHLRFALRAKPRVPSV